MRARRAIEKQSELFAVVFNKHSSLLYIQQERELNTNKQVTEYNGMI